ncbi:MAG: sodium/proline symporter [Archaeoglobaceae archaeon]|nr:sodium/proline symporter [Archaeoglobaceae archaeon]MDW7989989.1 sodium/proline symporter [Archaeoglobaceae archaeon]
MSDPVIVSIVVCYFIITFVIGLYAKRYVKVAEEYFGAHKLFGPILVGLASFAAIMSGFGFVGGPGLVYAMGATSLWITLAQAAAFGFSWWIIGKRIRLITEVKPVATLPDIAALRFKSEAVRGLLAISLVLGVFAYLGTQVLAGGYVVAGLLGVPLEIAIIIVFGITMLYTAVAGMAASILTDVMQGIVMLIAAIGVLIIALVITGGTGGLFGTIALKDPVKVDPLGTGTWMLALIWYFVFVIGNLGQPHLATKFIALKRYEDLKWGAVISGGSYMISSLLWIFVGYTALWFLVTGQIAPLKVADEAATAFLGKVPSSLAGIVYAGLLAAIMSTSSAFLAVGVGAIVRDLTKSFGKELTKEAQIKWGRVVTILLTVVALIFGYFGGYLVAILGTLGWGYFACAIVPIIGLGLNWKRATREAAIAALLTGLILNISFLILERGLGWKIMPYGIPSYSIALLITFVVMIIVSFFTKSASGEDIEKEVKAAMEV